MRGIDLEVKGGEAVAIVGVSGAGKSTLLHLLAGLDRPTAGKIELQGQSYQALSDEQLARVRARSIGIVYQAHHLLPEFTALENVMMPALIARHDQKDADKTARELLSDVGLAHRLTHRPGELSGGEQQRVAIARALALSPELLLADEPTGNLDMKTSEGVHELLSELQARRGLTLVIVTHNEHLAAAMEHTVRLVDGHLE
ncbi:MAG: Lipoprotein-releasing system ATP-binding protein LolD [bacterium ADurb.Bin478]|nr:MAG: Lipoprotein-releasing system ATP-binding protein LolD [bacterium ADurb.Bin478]